MLRILQRESEGGYADRVVAGGLSKFIVNLRGEAGSDGLPAGLARLSAYSDLTASARRAAVAVALRALGAGPAAPVKAMASSSAKATKKPVPTGLDTPVTRLFRAGPQNQKLLEKLGIRTFGDLLFHFPRKYLDRSTFVPIASLQPGRDVNVMADVLELATRKSPRRRYMLTEALLADSTGSIRAIWFNQPYVAKSLRGRKGVAFFGRTVWGDSGHELRAPEFELDIGRTLHAGRQVPVYPSTGKLSQKLLRLWASQAVETCSDLVAEFLPAPILDSADLQGLNRALRQIHFPDSPEDAARAIRRLAFDELFLLQLGVLERRREWREGSPGRSIAVDREQVRAFVRSLDFKLTAGQKQAVAEALDDLERDVAMNRLLQGDVGSGKTVVAACALLAAARSGVQAAVMAPTQILAEQHHQTLSELLAPHGVHIELVTGALSKAHRRKVWERVEAGAVDVVVGTHALTTEEASFASLNLVVVDEQHRFGVHQRARLRGKGYNPHMLVMTATPIPRTLALTIYGDLDVTRLTEMPPGRRPVKTAVVTPDKRQKAYDFVRQQIARGRQAFMIFPIIEESETLQARAAEAEFERFRTQVFPELDSTIGLLHGRMTNKAKTDAMLRFRAGETKLLVSTAVVEVGVDVPNASVMVVEGAERFGLAQLHQFRGRVGRGSDQGYCLLVSDSTDAAENQRLLAMTQTTNGFELAEKDLELRGPGEILGARQSGLPTLRVASLTDAQTLELARREAVALFKRDPSLSHVENAGVKQRLKSFWDGLAERS